MLCLNTIVVRPPCTGNVETAKTPTTEACSGLSVWMNHAVHAGNACVCLAAAAMLRPAGGPAWLMTQHHLILSMLAMCVFKATLHTCRGSCVRSSTPAVPVSSASSITRASAAQPATPISLPAPDWKAATRFSAGIICAAQQSAQQSTADFGWGSPGPASLEGA